MLTVSGLILGYCQKFSNIDHKLELAHYFQTVGEKELIG